MKKVLFLFLILLVLVGVRQIKLTNTYSSSEEDIEFSETYTPQNPLEAIAIAKFPEVRDWRRPVGPPRVALQVGHWKVEEHATEHERLRNNTGSEGGGKMEWEVNLVIAEETAKILREKGVEVAILPAKVPPGYWADVFVAIHADGDEDFRVRGYKVAPSWHDLTGNAERLVGLLNEEYGAAVDMPRDENITHNMRGYYAFSWWRWEHAIHPMTTAAIIETGFLTNPTDRKTIVDHPEISAGAIATALERFLEI